METLQLSSINQLTHVDDVEQFNENDKACFAEIKQVLLKHGKVHKFGITLLHKHFDLEEGEMLIETTDEINRVQTTVPMKVSDIKMDGISLLETCWSLADDEAFGGCSKQCVEYSGGSHHKQHVYSNNRKPEI